MNLVRVSYEGNYKIVAIKAVRQVFGLGLKEAKDAVEADAFTCRYDQYYLLIACYLSVDSFSRSVEKRTARDFDIIPEKKVLDFSNILLPETGIY